MGFFISANLRWSPNLTLSCLRNGKWGSSLQPSLPQRDLMLPSVPHSMMCSLCLENCQFDRLPKVASCASLGLPYLNKKFFAFIYLFACLFFAYVCVPTYTYTHLYVRRSENNLWELVLSFYHMWPEDQTWVIRLNSKHLYRLSHLTSPIITILLWAHNLSFIIKL